VEQGEPGDQGGPSVTSRYGARRRPEALSLQRATRRRRSALAITETELKVIAALATIGLRRTGSGRGDGGRAAAASPREDDVAAERLMMPLEGSFLSREAYCLVYLEAKRNNPKVDVFRRWLLREAENARRTTLPAPTSGHRFRTARRSTG
jgi:DNA-binding transcriptional LysR family regulator